MPIQVLAGVSIIKNKKVLLLQQKPDGDQPGKWGPPAGHAQGDETPIEAAKRETKEETNLNVKILGLVQSGIFHYKNKDYAVAFFVAKAKNLKAMKVQEEEVAKCVWASLDEIKKDKFPLRKKFLKESLLLSFSQKPLPLDSFKIFHLEGN